MNKLLIFTINLIVVLLLSSCDNSVIQSQNSETITPSPMNTFELIDASPSPSLPDISPSPEIIVPSFSTLSPDNAVRIECLPHKDDTDLWELRLVDIVNNEILIAYDYPAGTEFTDLWSADGYYCAIGYKNEVESRTVIYVAKIDIPATGKEIVSGELSYYTNSIHPQDSDSHIIPLEFIDKSTLLLSIDWIDSDGNRSAYTTTWDFQHGTYTELEKRDNE